MQITDYAIGTIVELPGNIKVKVEKETDFCVGCFFLNPENLRCQRTRQEKELIGSCAAYRRMDHTDVIFKKIK